MVSSVTSNVPYSYSNQLLSTSSTAASTVPAATTTPATTSNSDSSTTDNSTTNTNILGLPPEVLSLLQNVDSNDNSVSSLLGGGSSSSNSTSSLLGDNSTTSADNFLANQNTKLLDVQSTSGVYQAALNGASAKKAAATHDVDPLQNILAAYNAGLNSQNPASSVNTTT